MTPCSVLDRLSREIGSPQICPHPEANFLAAYCAVLAYELTLGIPPPEPEAPGPAPFGISMMLGGLLSGLSHQDDLSSWKLRAIGKAVHDLILAIDNDDGWPRDRWLAGLNQIALALMYGLADSRWPAEAGMTIAGLRDGSHLRYSAEIRARRHGFVIEVIRQALQALDSTPQDPAP